MSKLQSHRIGTLDDAQKTAFSALALVAQIRAAVGDPEGRLMQDELIEHCRKMHAAKDTLAKIATHITESNYYGGFAAPRGAAKVLHEVLALANKD